MHLNRFATRFAIALVVAAVVLLTHDPHRVRLLEVSTAAVLSFWALAELRHSYRRRRQCTNSIGSSRQ